VEQNTGDALLTILKWYEGLTDEKLAQEIERELLV